MLSNKQFRNPNKIKNKIRFRFKFKNRVTITLFGVVLLLILHSAGSNVSAHEVKNVETIEFDATPQFNGSRFGRESVTIEDDSTIVFLQTLFSVTTQDMIAGYLNFSNIILEYDGMEAYQTYLHQKIIIQDFYGSISNQQNKDLELAIRSVKLSDSALRDGQLNFVFNLRDTNDFSWSPYVQVDGFKKYLEEGKNSNLIKFNIETSLEFIRSTKQVAYFELYFSLIKYTSPNVPFDNFHNKQIMNTSIFPDRFLVESSLTQGISEKSYLFLPDEMLPKFFGSSEDHKLNLTQIPLTIDLTLQLSNKNNEFARLFKIESGHYFATRVSKTDLSENFRITIKISDSPIIPIDIGILGYTGEISVVVKLEMRSLFSDSGIYAKYEYVLSPNQHLIILVIAGTIITYKFVDYVDYRLFQNKLSNLNPSLLEEEFA